ncbi:hypothetical protein BRADI_3g25635v3 [Brachypodium distachyon]|uniref:Uncharacterized protein n=1 Tax=Brachypodium distachyon TaxID=15368 RepID=A0A2K2CZ83_BRADI|nr:hypothetical protein BRADI_3g25635v3 [Brachypodium distachyon]
MDFKGCLLCPLLSMSTIDGSRQKPPPTLDCLELLVTSTYCHKFDPCFRRNASNSESCDSNNDFDWID